MLQRKNILFTRRERKTLRQAKKRRFEELDSEVKDLLNRLIDIEVRIEEEKDPILQKQYESLKKIYEEKQTKLAELERDGLPLKDPVLQDVLAEKIGAEFVSSKITGEEELKDVIQMYESLIKDLEEQLVIEDSKKERRKLGAIIHEYKGKIKRIEQAIARERERRKQAATK